MEHSSMDVGRTGDAASTSTSTSSRTSGRSGGGTTYDVFLSFRGIDTRKTFADHLYTALWNSGIHTFRDDDELERGEDIELELERAIQQSRVSIIIFSTNYASSPWCLDELVKILHRRNTAGAGHKVLPVFYNIKPSKARKQKGSFAEAFAKHEALVKEETDDTRRNEWVDKVEGWRAALRQVANLGGMVLENQANGHEAKFIQEIVEEIENKLKRRLLSVALFPIGIKSRVETINLWLQDGSKDVGVGVICGMGGIGKTTIAKVAYNFNFDRFKASSFLANIRETSEQHNGLVGLQRQLLSDITNGRKGKISYIDEGIIQIKDAVSCKEILLILDDVDQVEQLSALIGMWDWFYPGSKIIITTRHEQLLKAHEVHQMYKIKYLDDNESLQLFSWHAFGQDHPAEGYMEHSKCVIRHCGGLPLALEVMGSSLSGTSMEVWRSALEKLEAVLNNKIQKTLEISYKSLEDDHDKNLFLHISSSFVGKDIDYVVGFLEESDFHAAVGIQNLLDRCLITISADNKVMIHQLLQEMARAIIRRESSIEPRKHSGVWHHRDSSTGITEETGTETVEELVTNKLESEKKKYPPTVTSVNRAKQPNSGDFLDKPMPPQQSNSLKRHIHSFFPCFQKPVAL